MKKHLEKIGKTATLKTQWGFLIKVKVLDYKNSYGRHRWLVTPLAGSGEEWVENIKNFD